MILSVVIPTRNRASVLGDCLASIEAQTMQRDGFEVIVVDNGSTDATPAVVAAWADRLPLVALSAAEPGLHVGRHAGMMAARGEVLVYCDDDIVADSTWLASIADAFTDPEVDLVGGNNRPVFEAAPPAWLLALWERPRGPGRALAELSILDFGEGRFPVDPGFVWGCNFSIRGTALRDAGGFHPDGVPEDRLPWRGDGETCVSDHLRRSGRKTLFHSGASVGHRIPASRMTRAYFAQRGRAQGVSDSFTDHRANDGRIPALLRYRRRLGAQLKTVLLGLGGGGPIAREMRAVRRATLRGWLAGYDLHRDAVAADPALRAWVLRETYY